VKVTNKENELENENVRLRQLLVQAGLDAAASDVAHRLQRLMLAELHHRVKNTLTMVQAIATQTLRSAATMDAASEAIQYRIGALARTHDLLLEQNWDSAQLDALLSRAVEPFVAMQRFSMEVPKVAIPSSQALSISLVINELATNALKYGALSTPAGRVRLTGLLDVHTRDLSLTWTESGGPPVQAPAERSFGTQLIESAGDTTLQYRPEGIVCELRMPIP
jgi:two-component sensor histidine kinase